MWPRERVIDVRQSVDARVEDVHEVAVVDSVRARLTPEGELRVHHAFQDSVGEYVAPPVTHALRRLSKATSGGGAEWCRDGDANGQPEWLGPDSGSHSATAHDFVSWWIASNISMILCLLHGMYSEFASYATHAKKQFAP